MSISPTPMDDAAAKAVHHPAGVLPMAKKAAAPSKPLRMHPGLVVADILAEQRVSGRKAAADMLMSANGLAKILRGEERITAETALRLGNYMGNGPELWLNMQQKFDLAKAEKEIGREVAKIRKLGATAE